MTLGRNTNFHRFSRIGQKPELQRRPLTPGPSPAVGRWEKGKDRNLYRPAGIVMARELPVSHHVPG